MVGQWLLENLYGIITTILGGSGLIGYLMERKKRKIQDKKDISTAKLEEANALETIQLVYDKFVKDSLDRYADFKLELDNLKKELESVYSKLEIVTSELNEEKKRSTLLKNSYEILKKKCDEFARSKKVK